jgi:anti-sigma-K factor RskA
MTTPDVHALTGAYVLNAVPELERAAFERHLNECDACAQEVRELRETAARLGQAAAAEPPRYLKSQVFGRINQVRQIPPTNGRPAEQLRDRRRWPMRVMTAAAAVLLVATATLGVVVIQQRNAIRNGDSYASAIASMFESGDVRVVSQRSQRGGTGTVLVSESQNRALLVGLDLPDPGSGKAYQAWYQDANESFRSAGLMPGANAARSTLLELPGIGSTRGVGISLEPAGGSPQPTDVVMLLKLQA